MKTNASTRFIKQHTTCIEIQAWLQLRVGIVECLKLQDLEGISRRTLCWIVLSVTKQILITILLMKRGQGTYIYMILMHYVSLCSFHTTFRITSLALTVVNIQSGFDATHIEFLLSDILLCWMMWSIVWDFPICSVKYFNTDTQCWPCRLSVGLDQRSIEEALHCLQKHEYSTL